jgi:hypothetical protein
MENKTDLQKMFQKVLQQEFPKMLRQMGSNIRIGNVISYSATTRVAVVKIKTTGQIINNPQINKNITSLHTGDEVILISVDANFSGRNYLIASFGGNIGV